MTCFFYILKNKPYLQTSRTLITSVSLSHKSDKVSCLVMCVSIRLTSSEKVENVEIIPI